MTFVYCKIYVSLKSAHIIVSLNDISAIVKIAMKRRTKIGKLYFVYKLLVDRMTFQQCV